MRWTLPNQLTVSRLLLAGVFFVLLALYELPPKECGYLLNICFVLYLVGGLTDVLDGYLARRWQLTSAFGRIADPFVDKVLVCGAFALLAGSNFIFNGHQGRFETALPSWLTGHMASGVQGWMVVAVVAREFIVSGIRGYSEAQGKRFPATVWGKLKMFTQSVAICAVLCQLANWSQPERPWAIILKLSAVWLSVAVTVVSGLAYINQARRLMAAET
jgi:CDP-diacylglycerol--glycerol-3-phosphate 3-phosphatidyltransferase